MYIKKYNNIFQDPNKIPIEETYITEGALSKILGVGGALAAATAFGMGDLDSHGAGAELWNSAKHFASEVGDNAVKVGHRAFNLMPDSVQHVGKEIVNGPDHSNTLDNTGGNTNTGGNKLNNILNNNHSSLASSFATGAGIGAGAVGATVAGVGAVKAAKKTGEFVKNDWKQTKQDIPNLKQNTVEGFKNGVEKATGIRPEFTKPDFNINQNNQNNQNNQTQPGNTNGGTRPYQNN